MYKNKESIIKFTPSLSKSLYSSYNKLITIKTYFYLSYMSYSEVVTKVSLSYYKGLSQKSTYKCVLP